MHAVADDRDGGGGALAARAIMKCLARQTQRARTPAFKMTPILSAIIAAPSVFQLKQCTFSCVNTRYQKVKRRSRDEAHDVQEPRAVRDIEDLLLARPSYRYP